MINSIKQKAIVGQNGKIELPTTELTEGTVVEVIVLVEADPDETDYLLRSNANKKQLLEALENVKQGRIVAVDLDEYEKNYRIRLGILDNFLQQAEKETRIENGTYTIDDLNQETQQAIKNIEEQQNLTICQDTNELYRELEI